MIDVTVYALWGLDENGNGVADVLENKALLVFRVVNGTWADGSHGDKTVVVLLEDGKGTLSNADVPTGMKQNQNYTNGHWDQTDRKSTRLNSSHPSSSRMPSSA